MSLTAPARPLTLGTFVVLGLALSGVASAYFTAGGSGSGSAGTGTTQDLTLGPATPATQVYPGGQAAVAVTVTNPNPGAVRLESLALDPGQASGGFAVDQAHSGCGVSSLTFAAQNNGGTGWNIPGNGSVTLSLVNALTMSTSASAACQGASFTVYLKTGL